MNKLFKTLNLIILSILFIFLFQIYSFGFENEEVDNYDISSLLDSLETSTSSSKEPKTNSTHIISIDRTSGRILFQKNAYDKTPMASTTKILTAIIALENCNLQDIVPISNKSAHTSGSTLGITENTQMSMRDLLYGLMLRSGNDCAVAIAEYIGGDLNTFSKIMNAKANKIGLINSNFVTPHGLDDPNHYTTAYELALLTDYALKNEKFLEIVNTKTTTVTCGSIIKTISNTNELLGNYEGVYGVKTGFTFGAGRCLVTACKKNNLDIIVVVLGANTKQIRTADSIKVLNYILTTYKYYDIQNIIYENFNNFTSYFERNINLEKTTDTCTLELSSFTNTIFPLQQNELLNINSEIYSLNTLSAPIQANTKLGQLNIKLKEEILLSLDIILKNNINKKTWQNYYFEILQNFFKI